MSFPRHPKDMGAEEVSQFLSDLAVTYHVAASTQNQALSAILFLYQEVLRQEIGWLHGVVRAKKPRKLPVVLTQDEVRAVLNSVSGTSWLMASLLYGSGLRLMECIRLRVKDVDFAYNHIMVRDGKGDKDRVTILPLNVKAQMQRHIQGVKNFMTRTWRRDLGAFTCHMPWRESTRTLLENGPGNTYSPRQNARSTPGVALNGGIM